MQQTLGRAYQRLRGNHPRRQDGNHAIELLYDALLAFGVLALPAGVALVVWGCLDRFEPVRTGGGAALIVLSPSVLLLWERLAWAPFVDRISRMD